MKKATFHILSIFLLLNLSLTAQCVADAGILDPPDAVSSFEGSALLDLGIAPYYAPIPMPIPFEGNFPIIGFNPGKKIANSFPFGCNESLATSHAYEYIEFTVDTDGDYTFEFNLGLGLLSPFSGGGLMLIEGSYSGDGTGLCADPNFLGTSYFDFFNANSLTVTGLVANQLYTLVVATDSFWIPVLFAGYSVAVTGPPNWDFVLNTTEPPSPPYDYVYLIEDVNSGFIVDALPTPDLQLTPPGEYCVHGLSYIPIEIVALDLVGIPIVQLELDIVNEILCADLSDNCVAVTITPCPTLSIEEVIQPEICDELGELQILFTDVPDDTYDIDYDDGQFLDVVVSLNEAFIPVPDGAYNNLVITVLGCTSELGQSATIETNDPNDQDCDGVDAAIDCDDDDDTVTNTNENDWDCDGVATDVDCDDTNPLIGGQVAPGTLCDDEDPATPVDVIDADGCTCTGLVGTVTEADASDPNATDPCACNNDQSANGAGDGTFAEKIVVDMNGITGLSICASMTSTGIFDNAGVDMTAGNTVDVPFTDIGGGLYELDFNHIDGIGYLADIIECTTGLPILDVTGAPLTTTNICYYPVIEFVENNEYCANEPVVILADLANLNAASIGLGFSAITFEYYLDGSLTSSTNFDPETFGEGIHSLRAVYTPDAMIGLSVDVAAPVCPTELIQSFEIFGYPVINTDFNEVTICQNDVLSIFSSVNGGNVTGGQWTTLGDGTFGDEFALNTTYTPGPNDILNESVMIIITSDDPVGPCGPDMDEIDITINPLVAFAGDDFSVCESDVVQLNATTNGTGSWTGGLGSFDDASNPSTIYNYDPLEIGTSFTLTWTTDDPDDVGPCSSLSDDIEVTIDIEAEIFAGLDQTICEGETVNVFGILIAIATSGEWSTSGDGIFLNANDLLTQYTPGSDDILNGVVTLILTSNDPVGACDPVQDEMLLNITTAATADAGNDYTTCSDGFALLVAASNGPGSWSGGLGTFDDPTSNVTNYTPHIDEHGLAVTLTWTTDDPDDIGTCTDASDDVIITFSENSDVYAGDDQVLCGQINVAMAAISNFAGLWTGGTDSFDDPTDPNTIYFTSLAEVGTSIVLTWTSDDPDGPGPCTSESDEVMITFNTPATADVGNDDRTCHLDPLTLNAIANGPGSWSGGAGSFDDPSLPNAAYTADISEVGTSVVLTWTTDDPDDAGPCTEVSDDLEVAVYELPVVNTDFSSVVICEGQTIDIDGFIGGAASSASWSTDGDGLFDNENDIATTYTPGSDDINNGFVTLTLTTNDPIGPCDPVSDISEITISTAATADAGNDYTTCSDSDALLVAAANGPGSWSGGLGTFDDPSSQITTYTPHDDEHGTAVTLTWTTNDPDGVGVCTETSDDIIVTFNQQSLVFAGDDQVLCGQVDVSLSAVSNFSGTWSGGSDSFDDATDPNATYFTSAVEVGTSIILTWTSIDPDGPCPAEADDVMITFNTPANASAGNDDITCDLDPIGLNATASGPGSWSGGLGSFDDASSLTAVYSPAFAEVGTTVILTWTTNNPDGDGPCTEVSDEMELVVQELAIANTDFNNAIICEGQTLAIGGEFGGSATSSSWTSLGDGVFDDANALNTIYTPGSDDRDAGFFTLILSTNDPIGPCFRDTDQIEVTITPAPLADAGEDMIVCSDADVSLMAISSGPGEWTGGLGTFDVASDNITFYTPHEDESGTTVTLTWTTYDPDANGPCSEVSDDIEITINPAAEVSAGPDLISCEGNALAVTGASMGGSSTGITWSSDEGSFSDENTLMTIFTPSGAQVDQGYATLTITTNDPDGPCEESTDEMNIFFNTDALALAGEDQVVCGLVDVQLDAITNGSGKWTGGLGSFSDISDPQAVYSAHDDELGLEVVLTWSTDDPDGPGPCTSSTDDVSIWYNVPADADAGEDQVVCGVQDIQLNAVSNVAGSWSGGDGTIDDNSLNNAIYSPDANEEGTSFQLTFTTIDPDGDGPCEAVSDFVIITINEGITISAGPDQIVCGTIDVVLDAASNVLGSWSGGLGSFADANHTNTSYTPHQDELNSTIELTWVSVDPDGNGPCSPLFDIMQITFEMPAEVDLGNDYTICGEGPVDLLANVSGSATSGHWSSDDGGFATVDPNGLAVQFTPSENQINDGFAVLIFETNDPEGVCDSAMDELIIGFNEEPLASVFVPEEVCGDESFQVSVGSNTIGIWSGGAGSFDDPLQMTTNYMPHQSELGSVVQLTWTSIDSDGDGPCQAVSDFGDIQIQVPAVLQVANEVLICQKDLVELEVQISGSATSVSWSTNGDGSFIDNTALQMTYMPGGNDIASGQVTLTVTSNNPDGVCNQVSEDVIVNINQLLVASAGNDILACGYSVVSLNANFIEGVWSGGNGTFENAALPITMYTPSQNEVGGSVMLTWSSIDPDGEGPCHGTSDELEIFFNEAPQADAGEDKTVCNTNLVVLGATASGPGYWSGGLGSFDNSNEAVTIYTPHEDETDTTVILTWTTNDSDGIGPCTVAVDQLELTVINCEACPEFVSLTADTEAVCSNSVIVLTAETTGTNSTIAWYHEDGTPIQNPNNVAVENTSCGSIDIQFYAVLTPSADYCSPVTMYTDYVTIYPEIEATTTCGSCSASVELPCDNYTVTWMDTQGNSGLGTDYFTTAINSGTVYFTIFDPNNDDDRDCSELELSCNYSCDGCPVLNHAYATDGEICSDQTVSLSVDILNDDGGSLEWFMNGVLVPDPNNVTLSSTNCGGELFEFVAVYTPNLILCDPVSMATDPVYVYPNIVGNTYVSEDQCSVGVNSNCGNSVVFWVDNHGNSGTGSTYDTEDIGPGWVEFTVVNPLLDYPGCNCYGTSCHSNTFLQSFNCQCEPEVIVAIGDGIICSGESITLADIVGLENVNQYSWFENGEEIPFESVLLTNNSCEAIGRTIVVVENNNDGDCDPIQQLEMSYIIYPDVDGEIISNTGSCSVIFNPNCDNFEVYWYTNDNQLGIGTVFTPQMGSSGEVTFVVQYDDNVPFELDCLEDARTVTYNCCNDLPNLSAALEMECAGASVSLNEYLNLPENLNTQWTIGDQVVENGDNVLLVNETCESVTLNYQGNYSVPGDLCTQYYQIDLSIVVYPDIEAEIIGTGDECHYILNTECEEYFDITWYVNDDRTGEGTEFSAFSGESGIITFVVQNPEIADFNISCASSAYETNFNCYEEPEPIIDLELTKETYGAGNLYSGDTFTYLLTLFNNSADSATDIVVNDLFPYGLDLVSYDVSQGSFNEGNFEWSILYLGAGESITLELTVQIVENVEGVIINYAQVIAANEMDIDSYPANNVPSEDDQDFVAVSVNANYYPCDVMDICVEPITPTVICPEFCNLGSGVEIVEANTLFYCSIVINGDCITYTPLPGLENYGNDFVEILACDDYGNCETVTVNVTIGNCDSDLIAVDDNVTMQCAQSINIMVLLNDIEAVQNSILSIGAVGQPSVGSSAIVGNYISYSAPAGYSGTVSFDYTVVDNYGNSDLGTITVYIVGGSNSAPVAINDNATTNYGQSTTIQVTNNDLDSDPIYICNYTQPSHGVVTQQPYGVFSYTPANGYYGYDTFTYQICDSNNCGTLASSYATVTINIQAPPVDDCYMTACAEPLQQIVICPETCSLTGNVFIQDVQSAFYCSVQIIGGCVYYTPLPGMEQYGTDVVTIIVCNEYGQCETIIVTVTVTEDCNPQPIDLVAHNDYGTIACNHSDIFIDVLANDYPSNGVSIGQVYQPVSGSVSLFGNGLLYTPANGFTGNVTFTYEAIYQGQSEIATVSILVQSDNNNYPITVNDYYETNGNAITINPLNNDFDPDGDNISICDISDAPFGSVQQIGNQLIYTPDPGYNGPDSFKYFVCDNSPCGNLTSYAFIFINDGGTIPDDGPIDCENDNVSICVEPGSITDICPSFCQFAVNYRITSVQNIFYSETNIINDECISYTPADQFFGLDEVIIKACYQNADGTLDITNCATISYFITTSEDCNGGGGLSAGDDEFIEVKMAEQDEKIQKLLMEIPNAFTPNSDGINDVFTLKHFDDMIDSEFIEMAVFNRNGQMIQTIKPARLDGLEWNGRDMYQEDVSEGTYFYKLSFRLNGKAYNHTGFIEIVR